MGQPEKCSKLIKKGLNPRKISNKIGINIKSINKFLYIAVGKGYIKRSDILFNFSTLVRQDFEEIISQVFEYAMKDEKVHGEFYKKKYNFDDEFVQLQVDIYNKGDITSRYWDYIEGVTLGRPLNQDRFATIIKRYYKKETDLDIELLKIYYELKSPIVWLGDMYWDLFYIENFLHIFVKDELKYKYGNKETEWWRKIPDNIRKECHSRREEDSHPEDAYNYTNLIDLKKIIDKNWGFFSTYFIKTFGDKKQFISRFIKLNSIRNKIMHTVKNLPNLDDFFFVHEFYEDLHNVLENYQPNY